MDILKEEDSTLLKLLSTINRCKEVFNLDGSFNTIEEVLNISMNEVESLRAQLSLCRSCQCDACLKVPLHSSDCAVHNMPASPNEDCDCELSLSKPVDGYVLVPVEPTDEMTDVADDVFHNVWKEQREYALRVHGKEGYASEPFTLAIYKAMINASPKPIDADKDE